MKKTIFVLVIFLSFTMKPCYAQSLENKVIAHRGAWKAKDLPQNSIASLNRAIEIGCGGAEFDVWMTIDDVLVVNHDPTYQGLEIESSTYEELSAKKLKNGEVLPTLEQYIIAGQNQIKTKLILEIKTSQVGKERNLEIAEACVETVERLNAQDLIEYICFNYAIGLKILELDKNAVVSYLSWKADVIPAKLKEDGFSGVDYYLDAYKQNPDYIDKAKNIGLITNVWTVNDENNMKWFLDKEIDYITTDEPEILLKLIEAND